MAKVKSEKLIRMFQEQYKLYSRLLKDRKGLILDVEAAKNPMPLLDDNLYFVEEELHEMGRELPHMKFWKNYSALNYDLGKAKEEFIDTIHFMLNIAVVLLIQPTMYEIPKIEPVVAPLKDRCELVKEKSLEINKKLVGVCALKRSDMMLNVNSTQMYHDAAYSIINDVIAIAAALQMSNADVFNLYMYKNDVNHKRQDGGY
jgi:dimeric dUTPase (all-alpha-NTP-PPase superfamily)